MVLCPEERRSFPVVTRVTGRVCHHCAQLDAAWEERKRQKNAWEATFFPGIESDLRELPKNVVLKAREILQGLPDHRNYRDFHGKRLRTRSLYYQYPRYSQLSPHLSQPR
jgi:hypothetical protein